MSKELIERGRKKVDKSVEKHHLDGNVSEKILEIVGATKAEYFGTSGLSYFEIDTEINQFKFYKYDNLELIECSYANAIETSEYKSEKIFIFSEEPEETLNYFVTEIVEE